MNDARLAVRLIALASVTLLCALTVPRAARAAKVMINPSNQTKNLVKGGGNEAQYALINSKLAAAKIAKAGITVKIDQDFYNSPKNASSWGANLFLSVHSNAGGGHGTETLYKTTAGKAFAAKIQAALLAKLPFQSRGLKLRTNLHILNSAKMTTCLTEVLFHDCATTSGYKGHPPSESVYLKTKAGQENIATALASGTCAYLGKTCGAGGTVTPPTKTGVLKGVVYKAPNASDRIAGATVTLNTGQKTTSSATGFWEFTLKPGTYTATAKKAGFQTGSKTTVVPQDKTVWGSIGLKVAAAPADKDKDGVPDSKDNCPDKANPNQQDTDGDGKGDACDPPPPDQDKDGVPDSKDNCPSTPNKDQKDSNNDGIGDKCQPPSTDQDGDGVPDSADNCPAIANPAQKDADNNGVGDACESTAGADAGGSADAGSADAGSVDAGPVDAGPVDAGPVDAGGEDTAATSPDSGGKSDTGQRSQGDGGQSDAAGLLAEAGATDVGSSQPVSSLASSSSSGCVASRAGSRSASGAAALLSMLVTSLMLIARRRRADSGSLG